MIKTPPPPSPAAERVQPRRWTRQEFKQLASLGFFEPDERLELVDGEIYHITPQSSWHATAITKVTRFVNRVFQQGYVVRVQTPLSLADDSSPEPDVAVIAGEIDDYRDAHPTTALLVVEVADTSLAHDRERKRRVYARAGIPEYWLVNLNDYRLEIFRNPAEDDYQYHLILGPAESIAPRTHPGHTVTVGELFP